MSWLSSIKLPRWLCLPKKLNSPGDYIYKYQIEIRAQIYNGLKAQTSALNGKLDPETIVSFIMRRLEFLPAVAQLIIHAALHGVADRAVEDINNVMGDKSIDKVTDAIMKKLLELK